MRANKVATRIKLPRYAPYGAQASDVHDLFGVVISYALSVLQKAAARCLIIIIKITRRCAGAGKSNERVLIAHSRLGLHTEQDYDTWHGALQADPVQHSAQPSR